MTSDDDFVAFATTVAPRLRQTGYLLCRDWHLAQDFAQTTLAKVFVNWKRVVRSEHPEAYSRKILLRVFLDHQRRRSSHEVAVETLPDGGSGDEGRVELRLTLIEALGQLTPRDRAIVVMRYWEDQSIETVAALLGESIATIKTRSNRSLTRLRALLGDDYTALAALQD